MKHIRLWLFVVVMVMIASVALAQQELPPPATLPGGAIVFGVVQWLVGFAIKKWAAAYNFVIGWILLLLSILGYTVVPELRTWAASQPLGIGGIVAAQTALVTGTHEWLLGSVVKPLTGRLSRNTSYLGPKV